MGATRLLLPLVLSLGELRAQEAENPASKAPATKWTFLIYMAADNDLEESAFQDLREMESELPADKVRVLVQLDRRTKDGSDRIEIEKSDNFVPTKDRPFFSRVLDTLPEQDTAEQEYLEDFLKWGSQEAKSEYLAVIIWGHGTGWQKTGSISDRAVAYDDSSGRSLTNQAAQEALLNYSGSPGARWIDLLVFDSCLMNMTETIYALQGTARFFLGSEDVVPNKGMPYQEILKALGEESELSPSDVGRLMVRKFIASYSSGSQGSRPVQYSLVEISPIKTLQKKIDRWVKEIMYSTSLDAESLRRVAKKTQTFNASTSRDLLDFVHRVREYAESKKLSSSSFIDATVELENAYRTLVKKTMKNSSRYRNANGTAIFIPIDDDGRSSWGSPFNFEERQYRQTPFGRESRWADLLDFMFRPS